MTLAEESGFVLVTLYLEQDFLPNIIQMTLNLVLSFRQIQKLFWEELGFLRKETFLRLFWIKEILSLF